VFLSATSVGIKPSRSSNRRPLHFAAGPFLTGSGHCQIACLPVSWLQQPIKNLAQLRQLILRLRSGTLLSSAGMLTIFSILALGLTVVGLR
jgi:hypothetical protein